MASNKAPPPTGPDQSRNEYIPSFISKRPFWADLDATSESDYLEHQRLQSAPKDTLDKAKWYDRGKKLGPAATKYRKGACENCGAMTHKTKECLSRPRKAGAKWTGRDIQADEVVEDVALGFDAKRDRWNGYDNRDYAGVVQEYEELEALKKEQQQQQEPSAAAAASADADGQQAAAAAGSGDKYMEETDMGRSQSTATRQLRLREDTAAYLRNLDLDSAKYDPKTRSMDTAAASVQNAAGDPTEDGFVRPQGDDVAFAQLQKYAWETQEATGAAAAAIGGSSSSSKLHLQANPTEGEVLAKRQREDAAAKRAAHKAALLAKYGDASSSSATTATTTAKATRPLLTSSEAYVEYDASGAVKGIGGTKQVARSKYAEDVRTNNHTSVWGSWWRDFAWGYACCHSTVKNSYCTGEAGKAAFQETEALRTGAALMIEDAQPAKAKADDEAKTTSSSSTTTKKRTLAELHSGIDEQEMEAYKRNRMAANDPMAGMLGKDELVD